MSSRRLRWVAMIAGAVVFSSLAGLMAAGVGPSIFGQPGEAISQPRTGGPSASAGYVIEPEYRRTASEVVVSLSPDDGDLRFHHSLLASLPDYSRIRMLLPKRMAPVVRSALVGRPYAARTTLLPYAVDKPGRATLFAIASGHDRLMPVKLEGVPSQLSTKWAQDLFEVAVRPDGGRVLLTSAVYKYFLGRDGSARHLIRDNLYLERLAGPGLQTQRLPLSFMGGNVLVDQWQGRRLALVGPDLLRKTRTYLRSFYGEVPGGDNLRAVVKRALGVDQVVVLGRGPQPRLMFHLDQAILLLPGGVAAVTTVVGDPAVDQPAVAAELERVRLWLRHARRKLRRLGYRVLDIYTTTRQVRRYEFPVNAVPYVDRNSGAPTLLLPTFFEPSGSERAWATRNEAALRGEGYRVRWVPSRAGSFRGGLHCLINVLR